MPATRPGEIVIGDHRVNHDGILEIRASRKWIPYPEDARQLICLALNNGWGVDDGLPTRHTKDGEVYIRVLIGRERGPKSSAFQFHLTWRLRDHQWYTTEGYVNVGTHDWSAWRTIRSRDYVTSTIMNNPVNTTVEETHADA